MPKLRKLRKSQKFQYNRNRKRIRKTQESERNENIKVNCETLKANWDARKPVKENMARMGLAFDANQAAPIASVKQKLIKSAKGIIEEDEELSQENKKKASKVVKELQKEAESIQKRQTFRFSKEEVKFITFMLDKHGDDFKAMNRDPKNVYQLTPKQIERKIVKFLSIPEQYAPEAKVRGLLNDDDE